MLPGRAKRAGSDAATASPRFLWLRFAAPTGSERMTERRCEKVQSVVRATCCPDSSRLGGTNRKRTHAQAQDPQLPGALQPVVRTHHRSRISRRFPVMPRFLRASRVRAINSPDHQSLPASTPALRGSSLPPVVRATRCPDSSRLGGTNRKRTHARAQDPQLPRCAPARTSNAQDEPRMGRRKFPR